MDTKDLRDHSQWAIALAVAGVAIAVAATAAGDKNLILIGLGSLSFGIGEMRNRQIRQVLHYDALGRPEGILTSYPRRATIIGTSLNLIGIVLFGIGIYRLLMS